MTTRSFNDLTAELRAVARGEAETLTDGALPSADSDAAVKRASRRAVLKELGPIP